MLISLALSLVAIASGTLLTYTWDEDEPLASRFCTGACIGFALLGLIGFILALLIGLTTLTLIGTAVVLALPVLLLRSSKLRAQIDQDLAKATRAISRATTRPDRWAFIYFLFYAAVAIGMWLVFSRAMFEKPGGIYTGVLNNYGDLPFHLSVITRFAFGQNFPPEDPTFAGARFTYPFLTDFISAMFVRAGATLRDSLFIENYFVGVALVGVLHRFGQKLLRNRTAAILTPVLIILNGGLGWAMLFSDVNKADGGVFQVLKHIPHSYTILPEVADGWRWGNAVTSLLVPQRGFLLGIPLAVIVFTQWWAASQVEEEVKSKKVKGKKEDRRNQGLGSGRSASYGAGSTVGNSPLFTFSFLLLPSGRRMLVAGVVAGLLPLVHAHSFIVVMGVGACLALINWSRWREWLAFFVVASVIAIPQLLWSTHGSAVSTRAFIGWEFGWDSGDTNFFWFWFKNTGLFIPLLIAALLWKTNNYLISRKLLLFFLPFTLCFIIPNMVKLAPWVWDNIKVLFYWWIASAPIVALLLARLWEGKNWHRVLAAGLFVVLTLAGALDVFAVITGQSESMEFDHDGVVFAEMIKQQTPPRATILHAPIHNTPVFLTGRRSLMGYPGHIWTHGINFGPRETDIRKIYSGSPDAASLLSKYSVDYVVIDPQEHSAMPVNTDFFSSYPETVKIGEYHLYKIKP
jgi:preprotein translocase subunit Sss1